MSRLSSLIVGIIAFVVGGHGFSTFEDDLTKLTPFLDNLGVSGGLVLQWRNLSGAVLGQAKQLFKSAHGRVRTLKARELSSSFLDCAENTIIFEAERIESMATCKGLSNNGAWIAISRNGSSFQVPSSVNRELYSFNPINGKVTEFYTIGGHHVRRRLVGAEPTIQRRSDLMGITLRVMVDGCTPFLRIRKTPQEHQSGSYKTFYEVPESSLRGLYLDHLKYLMKEMNFTVKFFRRHDGEWGFFDNHTDTWSGMISNLVLGEADLIGTCLAMNEVRARAVDYVLPSSHHHYAIVIDKESEARRMSWDHLLRPFSPGIWAAIGVCVAGAATTITICFEMDWDAPFRDILRWLRNLFVVFSLFFGGKPPEAKGDFKTVFQFTLFVLSLLGNVMFISYRASLTSTLAFTRSVKPFTDWDSFMRTDFSLIVDKFSKVDYLDMAANPAAKRVFDHRTDPENLFYNISTGMNRILTENSLAMFSSLEYAMARDEYRCKISVPWKLQQASLGAFAAVKGSPLVPFLRYHLMQLNDLGLSEAHNRRLSAGTEDFCSMAGGGSGGSVSAYGLGFHQLIGVFAILVISFMAAVVVCLAEKIIWPRWSAEVVTTLEEDEWKSFEPDL